MKQYRSFDRRVGWALAALGLLVAVFIYSSTLAGLPKPHLIAERNANGVAEIGSRSPIRLDFSEAMREETLRDRLSISPKVAGRWTAEGKTVTFWPANPLQPGTMYTVSLSAGSISQSGQILRQDQSWQVAVRPAEILYLSPTGSADLWRISSDGKNAVQLTSTGGKLFDYGVSVDGERIVYAVHNDQQGFDLWEMNRLGGEPRLILPCEADWCTNPAYSPDGTRLAYSRRSAGETGEQPGVPRLWMLDLNSLTTQPVYTDPEIGGFEPVWSPDGQYLAFVDGIANGTRILNFQAQTDFLLPTENGVTGAWLPDSLHFLYTRFYFLDELPGVAVYEVDVQTQQERQIWEKALDVTDYSQPQVSPDGAWAAAALRQAIGGPSKQLWLLPLNGPDDVIEESRLPITQDPQYTHSSYHWDPTGHWLVYQRIKLGSSRSQPQILAWDRQNGENVLLAEDAFLPQWLP